MPQNFRTQTLPLTEVQTDWVNALPVFPFPTLPSHDPVTGRAFRPRQPFFTARAEGYRALDVVLTDGRVLRGVLGIGDSLYVPVHDGPVTSEMIVQLISTPLEAIPDFSISEPGALWDPRGSTKAIESGNLTRLQLFGPPELEPELRAESVDDAWEEALRLHRSVHLYGEDLPAAIHGFHTVRLVAGGWVDVEIREASRGSVVAHRVRPKDVRTWRELLRETFTIDEAFTLGDLMRLLDLPPDVDREVYLRCTSYWGDRTVADWRRAVLADYIPASPNDVVVLEVYPSPGEAGKPFLPGWDLHGLGAPLTAAQRAADDQLAQFSDGDVIPYGLEFSAPATLRDLPLRIQPTFEILAGSDEWNAFYRRKRSNPDAVRPDPRYAGPMACTLRDCIGAILGELPPHNAMGSLLVELRERVAELDGAESASTQWDVDEMFRAIAMIIEPLQAGGGSDAVLLPLARELSLVVKAAAEGSLSEDQARATCARLCALGASADDVDAFQVGVRRLASDKGPRSS